MRGGLKSNLSQTVTYRYWTMDSSFMDNFFPNFLCRRAAVSYSTQHTFKFIGNNYDIYYMYDRMLCNAVISYLLKSTLYICIHCRLDILMVFVIDIVTVTRVSVYGSVLNNVVTYNIKHSRIRWMVIAQIRANLDNKKQALQILRTKYSVKCLSQKEGTV